MRLLILPALLAPLALGACVQGGVPSTGSTTGDAAIVGAAGGAILGQALGGDTEATLGGAAAGAAIGAGTATVAGRNTCVDSFGQSYAC